jgi:VPS28 protein
MVMLNVFVWELIDVIVSLSRLNILTNMNASEEITEEQARQFQMDLEMCYSDFGRLLSSSD